MADQRPTESFRVPETQFIGEQDGASERELKTALVPLLANAGIQRAYLARVIYDNAVEFSVCLCLVSPVGELPELVDHIGRTFAAQFRTDEYLDTMFISPQQESQLSQVCTAFLPVA